jgi:FkbM family methyltransferase
MPRLTDRMAHFALRKLGFFNRSYRERIAGREFIIPIINGRKTYASEPWMGTVIFRLFQIKKGAFIDVGVNLGQTLLKVAATDPDREYLGFEPNPTCVDYVWSLISANRLLGYEVLPAGIANQTTISHLHLFRSEDTDPSASTVPNFRPNVVDKRPIVLINFEGIPKNMIPDEIAVIKIDVEGGELFVIEGLMPLVKRTRPFLIVEVLPAVDSGRLERQKVLEQHLRTLNYITFRIMRSSDGETFQTFTPIAEIGVPSDLAHCDYVLAPREFADGLVREHSSSS